MTEPHEEFPDVERRPKDADDIRVRERVALGVLAVFGLFHAWASWGYAGPIWNEHGGWLYAVHRVASGAVLYRDFEWHYPPLALWLVSLPARLTGTSLSGISSITVFLYLVVLALFFLIVRRLTREVALPITIAALLFATGYACRSGAPLPLGTGKITIPVSVMFFLGASLLLHAAVRDAVPRLAAAAGVMLGLSMMSAWQLWGANIYLAVVGVVLLRRQPTGGAGPLAGAMIATVAATLTAVLLSAGGRGLSSMLVGLSAFDDLLLMAQPTIERLVIEVAAVAAITLTATCALWLCLAIRDETAGRWAGISLLVFLCAAAAHLGTTVAKGTQLTAAGPEQWPSLIEVMLSQALVAGQPLISTALGILDVRFQAHLFPLLLPLFLLIVLGMRWKKWADPALRNLVGLLLGLCLSARAGLGFQGSDWYNVLLEIPTFVLMLRLGGAGAIHQAGRAVLAALGVMIVLGIYAYASLARGPLTFRGVIEPTPTPRGNVRWMPSDARQFLDASRLLHQADPSGRRPMVAFGPGGRWNYFLDRPNPTVVREGLYLLGTKLADSLLRVIPRLEPPVLLLEHPFVPRSSPRAFSPWSWEPPTGPSSYVVFDTPRFAQLLQVCALVSRPDSTVLVRIHDCARQATR